jgi:hypothetical protein
VCDTTQRDSSIRFRLFLYHYEYPPPSGWSYGLLGSLGRRHAQTPCDLGFTRPRNVRCHQGHWSWSWPVWPLLEGYSVENLILQETKLGEYLSHMVGGVCTVGLRLRGRTRCVLSRKRKPNAPTPFGIYDKYSPDWMLSRCGKFWDAYTQGPDILEFCLRSRPWGHYHT